MSRKTKNAIMILLLIILVGTSNLTIYFALKENNVSSTMQGENNAPPSMPSGEGQPGNNNSSNTQSNNDNSNTQSNNDNSNTQSNNDNSSKQNNQTPPDINSQNDADSNTNENTPPSKLGDNNMGMNPSQNMEENKSSHLSIIYLGLFDIQSLGISLLIIYLIMSKFNQKSIKGTFSSSDKIIIYGLSIILATGSLTFLDNAIATNFVNNNENKSTFPNSTGNINSNVTYSGAKEITEDTTIESGEYTSSKKDENAILVSGNVEATLKNITVDKTGDSDGGDNTSFYGTNSAILATGGANLTLANLNVTTSATGANGIFSYGGSASTNNTSQDGTTINISNSKITTTKDNSGGIMTTGGGVMNAKNLEINTSGTSSAAIRTDRGGGTVTVDEGVYTTTGQGSPTIYSTADVTVKNASLKATASEGVVIEGKNSVTLDNVTLEDTNNKLNGKSTTYKNIFLYQSMSGDADTGVATFKSSNSKITTNKGDTLYVTNTKASITLENNTIVNNDTTGNFLRIKKDSWGNTGSNGGEVTLTLKNQKVTGNIIVDSISTLDFSLENTSSYEGVINTDNSAKELTLTLDKTSKIKLTGNSYVTSLNNEDTTNSNIDFNGYTLYVNGKAINN